MLGKIGLMYNQTQMILLCFLYLCWLLQLSGANERVFEIELNKEYKELFYTNYGEHLEFSLGTPPQKFLGWLHPFIDEVLVVDKSCGIPLKDCPRLCSNENFLSIYCPVQCRNTSPQNRPTYCLSSKAIWMFGDYYDSANSTSYSDLNRPWKAQYSGTRMLTADYSKDSLGLTLLDNSTLTIKNFTFANGLSMDHSLFEENTGVIGVSPSSRLFIDLYNRGLIENAVITIRPNTKSQFDDRLVVGQLDQPKFNTGFFPTINDNAWMFEFDSVHFKNHTMGTTRVLWNPHSEYTYIPTEIIDLLIEDKTFEDSGFGSYGVLCQSLDLKFQFKTKSQQMVIEYQDIGYYSPKSTFYCNGYFTATPEKRSINEPDWIIGSRFAKNYVYSYDFKKKILGIERL